MSATSRVTMTNWWSAPSRETSLLLISLSLPTKFYLQIAKTCLMQMLVLIICTLGYISSVHAQGAARNRDGQRMCEPNSRGKYYWWLCQTLRPGSDSFTKTITGDECPPVRAAPRQSERPSRIPPFTNPIKRQHPIPPSPTLTQQEKDSGSGGQCRALAQQWLARINNRSPCYSNTACTQSLTFICNEKTKVLRQCPHMRKNWPSTKYDKNFKSFASETSRPC